MHTNTVTNKSYIGQTVQGVKRRARANGSGYKNCNKMERVIKKYGWDSFITTILLETTYEYADYYEDYFIKKFDTIKNGYNITNGGHKNKTLSEEHKANISKSQIGIKHKSRHLNVCGARNPSARAVIAKNLTDGSIKYLETMSQSIELLGFKKSWITDIVKVCKGKRLSCYGYSFEYVNKN